MLKFNNRKLEKNVKHVQSYGVVLVSLLTLNIVHTHTPFLVFIVDFDQVNVSLVGSITSTILN